MAQRSHSERPDDVERFDWLPTPEEESRPLQSRIVIPAFMALLLVNWKVLVVGTVAGGLIGAAIVATTPRQYIAESLVAPTESFTQVQFEPQIKTVADTANQPNRAPGLTPERRQALVDLIRSSSLEPQVSQELAGKLPDSDIQPGAIVQHISGGLMPRSEILSIQATASTPDAALTLAQTWATAYVAQVNKIYTPSDVDDSIFQLRDQAQSRLADAQKALTASVASSQLESLDRQIKDDQQMLGLLQNPYQFDQQTGGGSTTAAQPNANASGNANSSSGSSSTGGSSVSSANDYRLAERRTLDDVAQTLRRLDATRDTVRALMSQSATDSTGTASEAAIALVKAQLVSISGGLPSQVQFQLPVGGDSTNTAAELQALAASVDQARAEVAADFETRRQAYEQHRAQQVAALEDELRSLRGQREQANAERQDLTSRRDLAQDTYTALARKAEETQVAKGTAGHEVELASQATSAQIVPKPTTRTVALAAALGLAAAGVLVLLYSLVSATLPKPRTSPARGPAGSSTEEGRVRATS